ncbi:MAG: HAD family hydrolase [Fidelibacterota bacterium]|nr:MAG: HAD family hydrolase [Candidatus Neomarinimicrobiota bacterium]
MPRLTHLGGAFIFIFQRAMQLAAIIWDWNGTLLDDVDYALGCMNQLLARREMPLLDRDRYRRIFGFPVEKYYRRLGFDFRTEPFDEVSREFIEDYYAGLSVPTPQTGAQELVRDLDAAGITQCILSAMEIEPLRYQLEINGFLEVMKYVQGLNHSHATSKVAEGKALLRQLGLSRGRVLFVGDTTHDLEVAQTMGLEALILAHGHQEIIGKGYGPHMVCRDLEELRNVLGSRYGVHWRTGS